MDETMEAVIAPKPGIEVIYAGGTISSLATPQGYREGGHVVDLVGQLEQHAPSFRDKLTLGEAEVAYSGLSENLDEEYLNLIKEKVENALGRNPYAAVITHGTDSMEQTARYLQTNFGERLKTQGAKIILTGANEDISAEKTDAWSNLAFAFESAYGDAEPGVYVAFHGRLIPADKVIKEPFNGVEMNYASVDDPEYQAALRQQQDHSQQLVEQLETTFGRKAEATDKVIDYKVNVIRQDHKELLDLIGTNQVDAVLLTLYHSGTANTEKSDMSVAELARKLAERGIAVFGVTENGEPCRFGGYETSVKLQEAGIVPLGDMLHDVALAKLQLVQANQLSPQQLKEKMLEQLV